MTLAAIELDDAAVALARDGILLVKSPGFALPEGDTLLVGDDARRQARLKPRMVNSLFWERLSNQAVVPGNPRGESYADLARTRVEKCAREFYNGLRALTGHLCAGQPFALELGHAAARMPGLADAVLGAGGDRVSSLPPGAGALGALHRAGNIIDEDWRNTLTVSLPCDPLAESEPVKPVE